MQTKTFRIVRQFCSWLWLCSLPISLLISLLMAGGWSAHAVHAQAGSAASATASSAQYDNLIRQAVQEFGLGHWTEAKVFFSQAHALNPNARTLRGLALSCYESRSYVESIGYSRQALQSQIQPLTAAMRGDLERLLEQSKQFVSRLQLEVTPSGAQLSLDQKPALLEADGALLLDPGEHELSVSAEGYVAQQRQLLAEGGNAINVRIALQPTAAGEPIARAELTAPSPKPAAPTQNSTDTSIVPWIVVGAGALVAVTGAVFVGVAAVDKGRVESPKADATWNDLEGSYNRAKTFFPLGFTLLGVGVAGAAAGLCWKFWPARERRDSARVEFGPGSVMVHGTF